VNFEVYEALAGAGVFESPADAGAFDQVAGRGRYESPADHEAGEQLADFADLEGLAQPLLIESAAGRGVFEVAADRAELEQVAGDAALEWPAGAGDFDQECGLAWTGIRRRLHPGYQWNALWVPTLVRHDGNKVFNLWWAHNQTINGVGWGSTIQNWRLTVPADFAVGCTKNIRSPAVFFQATTFNSLPSITVVNYGELKAGGGDGGKGLCAGKGSPRGGGGGGGAGFESVWGDGGGDGGVSCDDPNDQTAWGDDGTETLGGSGGGPGQNGNTTCAATVGQTGGHAVNSGYNGSGYVRVLNYAELFAGGGGGGGAAGGATGGDGGDIAEPGQQGGSGGAAGGAAGYSIWGTYSGKGLYYDGVGADRRGAVNNFAEFTP